MPRPDSSAAVSKDAIGAIKMLFSAFLSFILEITINIHFVKMSNNTWRWANVRPIAAYTGGLKGQVCSLAYELAAIWR